MAEWTITELIAEMQQVDTRRHPSANTLTPTRVRTSAIAAARAYPKTGTNRCQVLELIWRVGPLTCDEICQRLGMLVQSATPTINSLRKDGWLRDSGQRRDTRSGNPAVVWEAIP